MFCPQCATTALRQPAAGYYVLKILCDHFTTSPSLNTVITTVVIIAKTVKNVENVENIKNIKNGKNVKNVMAIRQQVIVRDNDWWDLLLGENDVDRYDESFFDQTGSQVRWLAALRDEDPNYLQGYASPHSDLLGIVRVDTSGWPPRYFVVREATPSIFHLSPCMEPEFASFSSWISQASAGTAHRRRLVHQIFNAFNEGDDYVERQRRYTEMEEDSKYDADGESEADLSTEDDASETVMDGSNHSTVSLISVDSSSATIDLDSPPNFGPATPSTIDLISDDTVAPSIIELDEQDLAIPTTVELSEDDSVFGPDPVLPPPSAPVFLDLPPLVMNMSRNSSTIYSTEDEVPEPRAMSTPRLPLPVPAFSFPESDRLSISLSGSPTFSPLGSDDSVTVAEDVLADLSGIAPIRE